MTPPEVDDRIVGHLVRNHLVKDRQLFLVHGRYAPAARTRFPLRIGDKTYSVVVRDEQSVLGVLGAWQEHRDGADAAALLVVTTGIADDALGWDLRGHAVRRRTLTVDRAEIVAQRFGAAEVEPRVRHEPWLLDALLDAEPAQGWPRSGPVLTHDAAVGALLTARFGLGGDTLDAGALLEWSRAAAGPARFLELPAAEQEGLAAWLRETVGAFAVQFTALVRQGRAADVVALGVVTSLLTDGASADVGMAIGGLLGDARADAPERAAFVAAALGTVERWIASAENGGPTGDEYRRRVFGVLDRADALARGAGVGAAAADHDFLPAGLDGRLHAVAATLSATPDDTAIAAAQTALERLAAHRLARLHPDRLAAATMAVRLTRWLATEPSPDAGVARAVATHARDSGWVDRALTAVWAGEAGGDPAVGARLALVHGAARRRRDALDERFGARLATWTEHAAAAAPGGALLVEQVLAEVAVPLLAAGPPLVIVVDGMSAAVAAELGEEVLEHGWTEVGRDAEGREAAVAVVPSITRVSRASLLTGTTTTGEQGPEHDGFVAFWRRHGRDADLLHKADLPGGAGRRFSERLVGALAGDGVVGVVLNTVDDALDHGREGDRVAWRLRDVTYLPDLLDAARSYGRPVVLVSDHGHVLDHSPGVERRVRPDGADGGARWRTGTPGDGEIELAGPRVLRGGGRVVVPWREDVRYVARLAGYHGGASLAEMTVPVLALVPDVESLPMGWTVFTPEQLRPSWWTGRADVPLTPPAFPPARSVRPQRPKQTPATTAPGLFDVPAAKETPNSLGGRVVATAVFGDQSRFVRRAPEPTAVAGLVDALVAARGELSATAAVAALGRTGRPPGPVLAAVQRLLNVEGYPVLTTDGRTVRLDEAILRLQFGVSEP